MNDEIITIQSVEEVITEETCIMQNEQHPYKLLQVEKQQEQLLPITFWQSVNCSQKVKKLFVLFLLIFGVSMATIMLISKHTEDKGNTDNHHSESSFSMKNGYIKNNINQSRYKSGPPDKVGHVNIYIRLFDNDSNEQVLQRFRLPVARYNRYQFPLVGPFKNFKPWIPVFEHDNTQQTVFHSSRGDMYVLPALVDNSDKVFSVAKLISLGYASLIKTGGDSVNAYNIASYFQKLPLVGSDVPTINSATGDFTGKMRIKYRLNFKSKYPETDVDDNNNNDYSYQTIGQIPRIRYKKRKPTSNKRPPTAPRNKVINNINRISKYWANIRPYEDNKPSYFGVADTGLPDGCQVEQAHILHRHGSRYPSEGDIHNINKFVNKLKQIIASNNTFSGPLAFLNTWSQRLSSEVLIPNGAAMLYKSGVSFWNTYGRILYNAQPGQSYYNATNLPKPLLRTTEFQRTNESLTNWALGFFGTDNTHNKFTRLIIPSSAGANNTLIGFLSCGTFIRPVAGAPPNAPPAPHVSSDNTSFYLANAIVRFSAYAPSNANLTTGDVYIMQSLCAFEYSVFDSSDFCSLFTLNEWRYFEQVLSNLFYRIASYGSATGRAQGLGYVEELIARLTDQYIKVSYSSVNSTLDSSPITFPLGQPFYMDMSHELTILSVLTALSLDYFRENVSSTYSSTSGKHFRLSQMTPFGARLITEKIGCTSPTPVLTNSSRVQYSSTQYGYSATSAKHKFIRIRLNNGILPLNTIRGGFCSVGRTDGLCPLQNFVDSQVNARTLANYQYVCFANYTVDPNSFPGDGNFFP